MEETNETLEQLELLIGKENAGKVFKFFEGMSMYFPKNIGLKEQHENIYDELRSGKTYQEMAIKYGYTKSYIRKIEQKVKMERRLSGKTLYPNLNTTFNNIEKPKKLTANSGFFFEQGDLFYGQ